MKNTKNKIVTVIILLATFVLAGVAIFTAVRLYDLRQTSVAPNVPSSMPKAADITATATPNVSNCSLSFTLGVTSPTPTVTATPTSTGIATPTPTSTGGPTSTPTVTPTSSGSTNSCNGTCGSNSNCNSGLYCYNGYCRSSSCPTDSSCSCGTAAPTATPQAALPSSGTDWPTTFGIGIGILTIIGAFFLAL